MTPGDIYLATVGIERLRWAKPKRSSIDLHSYIPRIAEAGFDGIELWEFHATGLAEDELERARAVARDAGCPLTILSTYVTTVPTDENVEHRRRLNHTARLLGAEAYKYNIRGPSREDAVRFVLDWAAETDVLFLCECHGGTLMEEPETAAGILLELGPERFPAILHSLAAADDEFERDLALKGNMLRHVHVQRAGEERELIAARTKRLGEMGLALTWSIEFSAAVSDNADNETCFAAAVEDMKFLRECLGQRADGAG